MRKTIKKKIAGEIPAIKLSPFQIFYPPSQKTTALAVDECEKDNPPSPFA